MYDYNLFYTLSMILSSILYVQRKIMDKKLMRNGNGWALALNSTLLQLIKVNPEIDMVELSVEGEKIIISKSPNKRKDAKNK